MPHNLPLPPVILPFIVPIIPPFIRTTFWFDKIFVLEHSGVGPHHHSELTFRYDDNFALKYACMGPT